MTDFQTWLLDYGYNRLFRVYFFNLPELEIQEEANYVFIKEAIELPDGDILLGLHFIFSYENIEDENPPIEYHKLSEMQLNYYPDDIEHFIGE